MGLSEGHLPWFQHNVFGSGQDGLLGVQAEKSAGLLVGHGVGRHCCEGALQLPVPVALFLCHRIGIPEGFLRIDVADDGILIRPPGLGGGQGVRCDLLVGAHDAAVCPKRWVD